MGRSRYGFAGTVMLAMVALWFALRLVLLAAFHSPAMTLGEACLTLLSGIHRDIWVSLLLVLPLLIWFAIVPQRWWRARWHRILFQLCALFSAFAGTFLLFIEFFFFEEFKSRFNTVAVDYLLYPYEVFVNIWQSYHTGLFLALCLVPALLWLLLIKQVFPGMWETEVPARRRWAWVGAVALVATLLVPTIHLKGARVGSDRVTNEIANNSLISFGAAFYTHHLDYAAYYRTIDRDEAYSRVRKRLEQTGDTFSTDTGSIVHEVAGDPARPRLNVILCLEESLGSEFWGCLGRPDSLTPAMDKVASTEGLLFTHLYASGNRTVRGLEGVLASFPPLPGDSIVKRDLSKNIETLARVLKRDGYSTMFLYGGRGIFDGMRSFALDNGYDRFIEQKHFSSPTFSTIWGVCDEDLFARTIRECREVSDAGKPFFATVLTVSNHKPYTYPKGRISEDPDLHRREHAVKYADYSLGKFFEQARSQPFWTNTIFVVVADHGARVYGQQSIPFDSYKIPLVIAGPAVVKQPRNVAELGGSLDVAPTLLGLIGRPYTSTFFGRDLFRPSGNRGWALLHHNRDIGMVTADRLVVLGLFGSLDLYAGDLKSANPALMPHPGTADQELERDAVAFFEVADDLYMRQRYHVPGGLLHARLVSPEQPH